MWVLSSSSCTTNHLPMLHSSHMTVAMPFCDDLILTERFRKHRQVCSQTDRCMKGASHSGYPGLYPKQQHMLQPSLYPSLPYSPQDTLADTPAYILSCSICYSRAYTLAYPIASKICVEERHCGMVLGATALAHGAEARCRDRMLRHGAGAARWGTVLGQSKGV